MVGELIPAAAETGLVAFSMCGMGPNHYDIPSMVLLPGLLYRNAFGHPLSLPPLQHQQSIPHVRYCGWTAVAP
jgi:hypothetical protein